MSVNVATLADVEQAEHVIHSHISAAPLIRSYELEKQLNLPPERRVWIKDYGWTPVGSFKLMGALNWMANHADEIGDRPVAAHSSGNFASGISFAGMKYGKRVIIVMPDDAPQIKFERTRSFGAEIRTYNKANDHITGEREKLTRQIAEEENAVQASPYDDNHVIAGNGVGGMEIAKALLHLGRSLSHFFCQVSGGGLMAGHLLPLKNAFPYAQMIAVEPSEAADFQQSFSAGKRVRLEQPRSICDGLLSYDVGVHNWPILQEHVNECCQVTDQETIAAMKWLYDHHGLRTEPSGAISIAAALHNKVSLEGLGDLVFVLSGRNVDDTTFRKWIESAS